jgi:hypothetical protein
LYIANVIRNKENLEIMSYYPKEENTTPAPGTEPKKFTGFEQWQQAMQEKLKQDEKFHSRTHADDDLKAYQKEEEKKFK